MKPKYVGFSSLTKAIYEAGQTEKIDWKQFLSFYGLSKNMALIQRTGYLLELLKKHTDIKIPLFVFTFFRKKIKGGALPVKLVSLPGKSVFNRDWLVEDPIGEKNILSWWY